MMGQGLDQLFRPRSVAVIGASSDPNKIGGRPIAFLKRAGYSGAIFPVNPSADDIQGLTAYASLDAVNQTIDQAIIALPAKAVLAALDECTALGVRAIQVFSAGFGEGGDQGRREQQALSAKAAAAAVRVLGPNSLGLFNTTDRFFGTFATALDGAWPKTGSIGVATQSGAFGSYFFGLAQARGLGFSHFVATGNECDVDVADCVAFLSQDPTTRVIVMAVEGCKDGKRLIEALAAARAVGKPVVAMKVGVSRAGARAAATHTGALSGEDRVFDAVLREFGAWRAHSLEELVDVAYMASMAPLPRGKRLAVVTTSGGIGVLTADAAEARGLELPPIADTVAARIKERVPLAGGTNPVDTSAGIIGNLAVYADIASLMLDNRGYDTALCFLAHIGRNPAHWAQLRGPLHALRQRHPELPFAAVLLADDGVAGELEEQGFAVFADPTRAVAALAACATLAEARQPAPPPPPLPMDCRITGELATEADAKEVLGRRGISFAPERHARSADEAAAAAEALGYPVVLKILSPDIPHKTEVGGVALGLADACAVEEAYVTILQRVQASAPSARIDGMIVAKHLTDGVEILVGTACDPIFGPVLTVGAGGVLAELHDDVSLARCPVTVEQALTLIDRTRAGALTRGHRGRPPVDRPALAQLVARLSEIAWQLQDQVAEIDLNPVLARQDGAFALDALVTLKGA